MLNGDLTIFRELGALRRNFSGMGGVGKSDRSGFRREWEERNSRLDVQAAVYFKEVRLV